MITFDYSYYGGRKAYLKHVLYKLIFKFGAYKKYKKIDNIRSYRRVIFVCKGNICRSAFAHHYYNSRVDGSEVMSFGLDTRTGKSANDRIVKLAKTHNVNLKVHSTLAVQDYHNQIGDIVICMEPHHLKSVLKRFPKANVALLGLFLKDKRPYIHDPYSSSDNYAKYCIEMIKEAIDELLN